MPDDALERLHKLLDEYPNWKMSWDEASNHLSYANPKDPVRFLLVAVQEMFSLFEGHAFADWTGNAVNREMKLAPRTMLMAQAIGLFQNAENSSGSSFPRVVRTAAAELSRLFESLVDSWE